MTDADAVYTDDPELLEEVQRLLLRGERLLAAYSSPEPSTGYIGVTDRRVIIFIAGDYHSSLVSIPFHGITEVALKADAAGGSMFKRSSTRYRTVKLAGHSDMRHHRLVFHNEDSAGQAHDIILRHVTGGVQT
ncbi:hypothetical protein HNR23_001979 [Nocardiopsis mwathae]|uniref:YokE-like PH domain-containing protein n=1 Tax=Nocardiopsis mwathae TaxID=1472723 RepID=A0A7X0D6B0_9ACTN|nr:PH domain-containing protein [Nocardiopsis mwathae]MBB6171919.1 hypothetical protein [Nocardiopsis mwathae]